MGTVIFCKKSGLTKLQVEGRANIFRRSKTQDFSSCYFPYILQEKKIHLPQNTRGYAWYNKHYGYLLLFTFHIFTALQEYQCSADHWHLMCDLGEGPFHCQICMSEHIFMNGHTAYCMVRQFSQEYIHWFCCHYWECWFLIHWSIMFLKRNPHNRKWKTLIKNY